MRDPLNMDLCSARGFVYAVWLVLATQCQGLNWFATVCSSWVWMSRATTRRSRQDIYGRVDLPSCHAGNIQTARSALLMLLCACRHVWWALEQPATSLMEHHPAMKHLKRLASTVGGHFFAWSKVQTYMGAFAGDTCKPLNIYSNARWIASLARTKPREFQPTNTDTVVCTVSDTGRRQVTDGKGLKETQSYTKEFGEAVLDSYVFGAANEVLKHDDVADDQFGINDDEHAWATAELGAVMEFLTGF